MDRTMLKSKIHRATVTGADVDYEGSIAVDALLLEEADILPFEKVEVYNITNGNRFQTYAITGGRGSGEVCVNGAAAHLAGPGDLIIIASYVALDDADARAHKPRLVYVDGTNSVKGVGDDITGSGKAARAAKAAKAL